MAAIIHKVHDNGNNSDVGDGFSEHGWNDEPGLDRERHWRSVVTRQSHNTSIDQALRTVGIGHGISLPLIIDEAHRLLKRRRYRFLRHAKRAAARNITPSEGSSVCCSNCGAPLSRREP
jgi:hypothetical protein